MVQELALTIAEAAELLQARRISSSELTDRLLARCHALQNSVSAFITICDASARNAARIADLELAQGTVRGPLHGIPLAVKDILSTANAPTTAASRAMQRRWRTGEDAAAVRKLVEAGAVILGKLTLMEFASVASDPAMGFPIAKNPWDLSRSPGASSSGPAAAVAAGLALGALGSDTGGSIRGPAAYCGISGLAPSFGRVSKDGCVPLAYSLDTVGPMARTARDCALIMNAIAGYDPADPYAANAAVPDFSGALSGTLRNAKVGIPRDLFALPELESEISRAVLAAVDLMEEEGATLRDVVVPHFHEAQAAWWVIDLAEQHAYHEPTLKQHPELYGKYVRQRFRQGAFLTASDYIHAQRVRSLIRSEWARVMEDIDVLVLPTMLSCAPLLDHGDVLTDPLLLPSLTSIWNLVGFPALSVCCGFSERRLPIGLQIVGKAFDEATVLRVGEAYQRNTDWHLHMPPL